VFRTATLAAALAASACGVPPERSIVDQFFEQSKLRDKTALQHTATVIFEPHVNGIVEKFDITSVAPEENGSKNVTVRADVKQPDGRTVQKTIVLTLSRGVLKDDPDADRRWIVTGFIDSIPRL
jgi:hypothetical protein